MKIRDLGIPLTVLAAGFVLLFLPADELQASEGNYYAAADGERAARQKGDRTERADRLEKRQARKDRSTESSRRRTDDGVEQTRTTTDGAGNVRTEERTRSRDAEAGTYSGSQTTTGADGQTRMRETAGSKTEDGRGSTTTFTGPDGEETGTRDLKSTRDAETGNRETQVQLTGADGQSGSRVTQTDRTDDGVVRNTTVTGADGQEVSRERTSTRDEETGVRTSTKTTTDADGQERTRQSQSSWDAESGSGQRSVEVTGADGKTATGMTQRSRTEDGYQSTTTTTGPRGQTGGREVSGSYDKETGVRSREVTPLPEAPGEGD